MSVFSKRKNLEARINNRLNLSSIVRFAEDYLLTDISTCMRCKKPSKAAPIQRNEEGLIVAYVCPDSHVSRVVNIGTNPDLKSFEHFLRNQLGERVRSRDVRKATRYGWELAGDAENRIPDKIIQVYWTFYARNENEKEFLTILCSKQSGGCGKLFTRSIAEESVLCPDCSKRKS